MLPQIDGVNWKTYDGRWRSDVSKVLWKYQDADRMDVYRGGITIDRDIYGYYAEYDPLVCRRS